VSPILESIGSVKGFGWGASPSLPTAFESIATVTADGSSQFVYFTSIPQTYTHLQIRGVAKNSAGGSADDLLYLRFNDDTGNNYNWHCFQGNGATASGNQTVVNWGVSAPGKIPATSSYDIKQLGATIIDILDYSNTNKAKVWRSFNANPVNDSSRTISFNSASWMNTSGITKIQLGCSNTFTTTTTFALYGIKGA
jgi:hypothetical protein